MALFQKSVLNKYLKTLDDNKVNAAYKKFTDFFHNETIKQNIREDKEEQFQYGFLQKLFDEVLDYTINPNPDYNLTTEFKNLRGAKKADGAILKEGKAIGVIELKSTKTKELSKITDQAFGYKNNHPTCAYVITSNFEKLRFYINDAVDYLDFDLFALKEEQFKLLYLCLQRDQVLNDVPQKIKRDSALQEENVTKKLYKDYSAFKTALFNDLLKHNTETEKLTLFKKSQKLIDRFLFILFAEDKGLLPPNSITQIVKHFDALEDLDNYKPLYEVFKQYFGYINAGRPARKGKAEIFAFNGGLFAPDAVLDNLKITDNILQNHLLHLSAYDFESEVDVNILGHIFEHSLNEIDEISAELEGQPVDKSKTKRKKDGVFYTPKYITKYIVDNTVGKLCEDYKTEHKFDESEYRPKRTKAVKKRLLTELEAYRSWLLSLTICDPACGSGAFLNQALDFLINEHRYLDELQTRLLGGSIILSDITNDILERNIYGVDINEESVDIARLSLWLRTAQKGRALTTLSNNIKCGNSLIDDPEVAGEKAFHWESEFPDVFKPKDKQAFHVVLTTHNSRTSERMRLLGIQKGTPVELNPDEELKLTEVIGGIIQEKSFKCAAFNICKDHVHLLLVCEREELINIVKQIKGVSSRLFNEWARRKEGVSKGLKPLGEDPRNTPNSEQVTHIRKETSKGFQALAYHPDNHQGHLWSQKFFRADLDVWQLSRPSPGPGLLEKDSRFSNTLRYIQTNRAKHGLPASEDLQKLIDTFTVSPEAGFAPEYSGGFDVVLGNPPYVRSRELFSDLEKDFFYANYESLTYQPDLYKLFIEKSVNLLKGTGKLSFITPSVFMVNDYDESLRKYLIEKTNIVRIANTDEEIFRDASVKTVVFVLEKQVKLKNTISFESITEGQFIFEKSIPQDTFDSSPYIINEKLNLSSIGIIEKLKSFGKLKDTFEVKNGIKVRKDLLFTKKESDDYYPFVLGRNVKFYRLSFDNLFIHYTSENEKKFTNQAFRSKDVFEQKKLIVRQILGNRIITCYDEKMYFSDQTTYVISCKKNEEQLKELLCVLNSKLLFFFFQNTFSDNKITFPKVKRSQLLELPLPQFLGVDLSSQSDKMIKSQLDISKIIEKFERLITRKFNLEKLSKNLQNWHTLSFAEFVKELKKKKVKLSLAEEAEWEDYFESEKAKAVEIQAVIDKTDREIDRMVYDLYGLTEEEIAVVENS